MHIPSEQFTSGIEKFKSTLIELYLSDPNDPNYKQKKHQIDEHTKRLSAFLGHEYIDKIINEVKQKLANERTNNKDNLQ